MIDVFRLRRDLNPVQLELMEEILMRRDMTLDCYKLFRKNYSGVKSRVRRIEKKLLTIMQQVEPESFVPRWIQGEVSHIEKKYILIEKAIRQYKFAMKSFNDIVNAPGFIHFDPDQKYNGTIYALNNYLSSADRCIDEALGCIRITERYFKNITSAFEGHARLESLRKNAKPDPNEIPPSQELS